MPQNVKGTSSPILYLDRAAISGCQNLPLRHLHITHFDITDQTIIFDPRTQKTDILTWLNVMSLLVYATWSWQFEILQSFCNSTRCLISCCIKDFWIVQPTLNTLWALTYGSSLNNLLFASNLYCLLSKTIFFPN